MYRRRPVSLGLVIWVVIGLLVASTHHYLENAHTVGGLLSAVLAVVLWPLILIGFTINIAP
jgi:ABC-type anion transport system duplicated permease subunit